MSPSPSAARTRRIICVCSGNICRSPMAEVLLRQRLEALGVAAAIISAGTLNIQGQRAAEHARVAVGERGLSLESHRSQGLSLGLARLADHLVVMAPEHERHILQGDRQLAGRVVRLWAYAPQPLEAIFDPVGRDFESFVACRNLIEQALEGWMRHAGLGN